MKHIILIFSILCFALGISFAQVSFGKPEKFNEQWQFHLGDDSTKNAAWRILNLPHDWSIEGALNSSLAACTGYLPGGIAWYKKTFSVPESQKDKKMYIYFEGVMNRSDVYLNGHLLGSRPNGYVSFMYELTPYLNFGAENTLAVRVNHSKYADSRWYNGSGIYRNVWLVIANPVHIAQWGIFAFPQNNGVLDVEIEIDNNSKQSADLQILNELIDNSGKTVATNIKALKISANSLKNKISAELKVANMQLWDLKNPNLYKLKTSVWQNGEIIDETVTTTAFRNFTFDADRGFFLNGKNLKMKGVCIHHDAGVLGAAVPREVWKRRLQTLKSLGCYAIRMTHNLQNPDVYDLCDELGLLVLNEVFDEWEFPKRKWLKGWNVGEPGFDGASDYFDEWGERDLADGIRRDRNHPSIFAWSIGNEVDYPNDPYSHPVLNGFGGFTQMSHGGYKKSAPNAERLGVIAKRLVAVVKEYDKSRPVTAGLAGVAMSNETEYPYLLDICGYNYTESRYAGDHKKYPTRIIYGSENRHEYDAWKAVKDNEHIFAQFLWTGIDYLGESGVYPARGFYSGLLDFAGFIKPRGYFREALWADEPTIYIGTYPNTRPLSAPSMDAWSVWNYENGQNIRVVCYTNAEKAQLFLNGKPVGEPKKFNDKTAIISWDIPYEAGKLEAVGYVGNQEVARYAIQTAGNAAALVAKVEQENGLTQITVQIVDENGVLAAFADNEITCTISSNAKLLGLEAGNNTDMGDYRDNRQHAFRGRLLAYIQNENEAENVKVKFSAEGLKGVEVEL